MPSIRPLPCTLDQSHLISDHLHAKHQTLASYIANNVVLFLQLQQFFDEVIPHHICLVLDVFLINHLNNTIVYSSEYRGKGVRSWCDGSSDGSFMVDPLSYFSFQPVLIKKSIPCSDSSRLTRTIWYNKGCGMCYPVCEIMHIKEPLLLIGKSFLSCYLNGPLPYV